MKVTQRTMFILVTAVTVVAATFLLWRYFDWGPSKVQLADLNWYVHKAEQWELQARILRTSQVALAVVAIIASVMSASQWKPASLPSGFLAVLAAVSIALLTGLHRCRQSSQ